MLIEHSLEWRSPSNPSVDAVPHFEEPVLWCVYAWS